jgi:hypothetical protein
MERSPLSGPAARPVIVLLLALASATASAAERPALDRAMSARPAPAATAALQRAMADPALRAVARVAHVEPRHALPTFLWAAEDVRRGATRSGAALGAARAARAHLGRVAPFYRLDRADVRDLTLRRVHDTGRGGVIATFAQVIDGVEVFRDALSVMMDRGERLVAVSGYVPGRALLPSGAAREFRLSAAEAAAAALGDFTGGIVSASLLQPAEAAPGADPGPYESLVPSASVAGFVPSRPLRARRVWFHLPDRLVPAWYVEVVSQDAAAYVVSAADGELLFRRDLVVSDSYTYRVWADAASPFAPWDGPQGTGPSPHPTGFPDLYDPPFVATGLVTLQNSPYSMNDPWLPPGATQTSGNNVDAYADISGADGFDGTDLRAPTTSPGTFDHTYDTGIEPFSTAQRRASVTQLFYTINFLHDWFYDSGFDEPAGNAQVSNYGRGGLGGDPVLGEAQDWSGTNNANMLTPADGGSPRMQMYVWNRPAGTLTVASPAPISGSYLAGTATFGPQTFSTSGTLIAAVDGVAPTGDGCTALVNTVAGKIVLVDRSSCTFVTAALNAQAAGAIGVIVVDNLYHTTPPSMSGSGAVTIPVISVTKATGDLLKAQLGSNPSITIARSTSLWRDGTLDNQIVAHEWGHYISNRLVGGGGGLSTQHSGGMGEGWADFHALLLTARAGDDFNGVYNAGSYATTNSTRSTNAYYFGVRRYPYTTDMTKNPLTFGHIQQGVPLPAGPPVAFGSDGASNAAVHRTGEVWCTMLWECYAALLNDPGRLTFAEAQQRMRDYLVAGYKMTPSAPTFTEARDAILAAAAANDAADLAAFWAAFAKRGCGTGAVPPDRYTTTNIPVVESFAVGADLAVSGLELGTTPFSCDADAYVDEGEVGEVSVTLRNMGASTLSATTATVTSSNPAVTFPDGNTVNVPATGPFESATVAVRVRLVGMAGVTALPLDVEADDPALLVPGPRSGSTWAYVHADEEPSATHELFDTQTDVWTYTGDSSPSMGWHRREYTPGDRRLYAFDPGTDSDASAVSPPLTIGGLAPFRIFFDHAYRMENTYDGGVLEISTDDGATWTDLGASITGGGYTGTIVPGSALSGRSAWTGTSPGYPALTPVTVDLGMAYAGQTVRVRFRTASDGGVGDDGWSIANVLVQDNQVQVFRVLVAESSPCGPLTVEDGRPAALDFSLEGGNPVRGPARFRFSLPERADVDVSLFDVSGRRVAVLAAGPHEAGVHTLAWSPGPEGAGVYFARLATRGRSLVERVLRMP